MAIVYTSIKLYDNINQIPAKRVPITSSVISIWNDLPNNWKTSRTNDSIICHNHGTPICELGNFQQSKSLYQLLQENNLKYNSCLYFKKGILIPNLINYNRQLLDTNLLEESQLESDSIFESQLESDSEIESEQNSSTLEPDEICFICCNEYTNNRYPCCDFKCNSHYICVICNANNYITKCPICRADRKNI